MKKFLMCLMTTLTLPMMAGCFETFTEPLVEVIDAAKDEPTVKSGMTSRDAADLAKYRAYVNALKNEKPQPIFEMEAQPGEKIEITGLRTFKVFNPTSPLNSVIKAPQRPKSGLAEGLEATGKFVKDVGSVVVPWSAIEKGAETVIRLSEIDSEERMHNTGILREVSQSGYDAVGNTVNTMKDLVPKPE